MDFQGESQQRISELRVPMSPGIQVGTVGRHIGLVNLSVPCRSGNGEFPLVTYGKPATTRRQRDPVKSGLGGRLRPAYRFQTDAGIGTVHGETCIQGETGRLGVRWQCYGVMNLQLTAGRCKFYKKVMVDNGAGPGEAGHRQADAKKSQER